MAGHRIELLSLAQRQTAALRLLDDCLAQRMLRAVAAGKAEVTIAGWRETAAVYVKRWAPRLFDRIIRSARVT